MVRLFAAECEAQERAQRFLAHFESLPWTSADGRLTSGCTTELVQDGEGHWWGVLGMNCFDWEPVGTAEGNYLQLELVSAQGWLKAQALSGPGFRYAAVGDLGPKTLKALLSAGDKYSATAASLLGAVGPEGFRLPVYVQALRLDWVFSEAFWQHLGAPSDFTPVGPGYLERPGPGRLLSGGIEAPPPGVVEGTLMRVVVDPQQAEALRERAAGLTQAGDYEEALELLGQAQRLNPLSADIHFDQAVTLRFQDKYPEALEKITTTMMLSPPPGFLVLIHQLRGDVLRLQGRLEEALEAFQQSLDLRPPPQYLRHPMRQRAELLAELGRTDEARAACDAVLELSPGDAEMRSLRARLEASGPAISDGAPMTIVSEDGTYRLSLTDGGIELVYTEEGAARIDQSLTQARAALPRGLPGLFQRWTFDRVARVVQHAEAKLPLSELSEVTVDGPRIELHYTVPGMKTNFELMALNDRPALWSFSTRDAQRFADAVNRALGERG